MSVLEAKPQYRDACEVLNTWQKLCAPRAREPLSDARVKQVIARLKGGYTVSELITCVQGYARFPFLVRGRRVAFGHETDRYVEAEFIFRKPQNVDRGITMALADAEKFEVPAAAIAKVSWRRVWMENRRLIVQALQRRWGHGGIEGSYHDLLWPCPYCEQVHPSKPGQEPLNLAVFSEPGLKLAECWSCGLTEDKLLSSIIDAGELLS
jgi:hypothetical protein